MFDESQRTIILSQQFGSLGSIAFRLGFLSQLQHLLTSILAVQIILQILFAKCCGSSLIHSVTHQEEVLQHRAFNLTSTLLVDHLDGVAIVLIRLIERIARALYGGSCPVVIVCLERQHIAQCGFGFGKGVENIQILLSCLEERHHFIEVSQFLGLILLSHNQLIEHEWALCIDTCDGKGCILDKPLVIKMCALPVLILKTLLEIGHITSSGLDTVFIVVVGETDTLIQTLVCEVLRECRRYG